MWNVRSVSCAGLADGLRGDDARGLAEVHETAGGQVAVVAARAHAAARIAGEHGADAILSGTRLSASVMRLATTCRSSRPPDHDFVRDRVRTTSSGGHAAEDALREADDDVLAVLQRADRETTDAAVVPLMMTSCATVHQTAGQGNRRRPS